MRKALLLILIPLAAVITFSVLTLINYRGGYTSSVPVLKYDDITIPRVAARLTEEPLVQGRGKVFLLDTLHRNNFKTQELNAFLTKVGARGYTVDYLGPKTPESFSAPPPERWLPAWRQSSVRLIPLR